MELLGRAWPRTRRPFARRRRTSFREERSCLTAKRRLLASCRTSMTIDVRARVDRPDVLVVADPLVAGRVGPPRIGAPGCVAGPFEGKVSTGPIAKWRTTGGVVSLARSLQFHPLGDAYQDLEAPHLAISADDPDGSSAESSSALIRSTTRLVTGATGPLDDGWIIARYTHGDVISRVDRDDGAIKSGRSGPRDWRLMTFMSSSLKRRAGLAQDRPPDRRPSDRHRRKRPGPRRHVDGGGDRASGCSRSCSG